MRKHVHRKFVNVLRVTLKVVFLFSLAVAPLAGALKPPALQQTTAFLHVQQTQQYPGKNESINDSQGYSGKRGEPCATWRREKIAGLGIKYRAELGTTERHGPNRSKPNLHEDTATVPLGCFTRMAHILRE